MKRLRYVFKSPYFLIFNHLIRWTLLTIPVAIVIGAVVALFLWLLSWAIHFRFAHTWLLYLLPLAGFVIHFVYKLYGKSSEKGNNLIMDEIHEPGGGVPKRMAPLVLGATVFTHLFGGSAGREGTAVQIGGSIADFFGRLFRLNEQDSRTVLMAGVAAGFGAVFGTPLAGTIFAIEVLAIGKLQYDAIIPCLIASIFADQTVAMIGIHHTAYHIDPFVTQGNFGVSFIHFDYLLLVKVILASILFGLTSYVFSGMAHGVKNIALRLIKTTWLIPVVGGLIIIGLTFILGRQDYLSLGVDAQFADSVTIPSAFHQGGADTWSWLWKIIYTTITLGTGFKGGEVTPLFYIGATLGNTLSQLLNAPVGLFAALGFIAVFAGATNTPLACTFMGIELFGGEYALYFAIACFTAYFFSGHSGIYSSQRIAIPKIFDPDYGKEASIGESMQRRRRLINSRLVKYKDKITKKK
ncbi:voltage-gated chloride channel family protein [Mucilaginibacter sp. BT774]|uniref:voltage-gated chloride channel family protein n=1 Tax=Mucilaginibacter sp. BT774 TaxID=3062276 RepID=UPI002675DD40|nr:voltage-gated chloride channel family protein [Mucilaginibacter sp. BT774]MDO3627858.1 voltage-gated chloride channel family protein [Mucilaginibacter sp. BT774]